MLERVFKMWSPVEIFFIFLSMNVWIIGEMISRFRRHLPDFILQSYLYGSFSHSGEKSEILKRLELPKSGFKHMYVFAAVLSSLSIALMCYVYSGGSVPLIISDAVKFLLLQEEPSVCAAAAFGTIMLLTLQIYRRFYETQWLQVFAQSSRINLLHYVAGFAHYLGCIVTVVGQAPLFSGTRKLQWLDTYTAIALVPCTVVFLWAWHEQYCTNKIFSNLRRDKKSGAVVTEDHGIPKGRLFEAISSPHRFTEIIMYTSLLILFPTRTFLTIYLWVFFNQIQTAVMAHQWYRSHFKNYPEQRRAIFPHFL